MIGNILRVKGKISRSDFAEVEILPFEWVRAINELNEFGSSSEFLEILERISDSDYEGCTLRCVKLSEDQIRTAFTHMGMNGLESQFEFQIRQVSAEEHEVEAMALYPVY